MFVNIFWAFILKGNLLFITVDRKTFYVLSNMFFFVDRVAVKFFLNIRAEVIPNSIMFFQ